MRYTLKFSEIALKDISKHKKSGDRVVLKKIEKLLSELIPTEFQIALLKSKYILF